MSLKDGLIHAWPIDECRGLHKKDHIGVSDWEGRYNINEANNGRGWSLWNRSAIGKINPWSVYIVGGYGGKATGMNPATTGGSFSWNLWFKFITSKVKRLWNDNNGTNHSFSIYTNTATMTLTWTTPFVAQVITTSGLTVAVNEWHMYSFVYDIPNNLIKIYVDATEYASAEPTGVTLKSNGDGGWEWGNDDIDGVLENVWMWNRALTQDEVTALYNGGNGISIYTLLGKQIKIDANGTSGTGSCYKVTV